MPLFVKLISAEKKPSEVRDHPYRIIFTGKEERRGKARILKK